MAAADQQSQNKEHSGKRQGSIQFQSGHKAKQKSQNSNRLAGVA